MSSLISETSSHSQFKPSIYIPTYFQTQDQLILHEIIQTYPFATLILTQDNFPHVVHLPLLFDLEKQELTGHIARSNQLTQLDFTKPYHCLVIFQGPDAYISPTWYLTKQTSGKVVPTWNYLTIHIQGSFQLIHEYDWILNVVSELSNKHEQLIQSDWKVSDAPSSYIQALTRGIVGVKISIQSYEGKFKLSQNKSIEDIQGVLTGLRSTGNAKDRELADWMQRFLPQT